MFVDRTQVHARAGNGGAGVAAFVRAKGKPQGKPTGGNGGNGGDVIFRADDGVSTLLNYRRHPHHKAGSGSHGTGDFQHGRVFRAHPRPGWLTGHAWLLVGVVWPPVYPYAGTEFPAAGSNP